MSFRQLGLMDPIRKALSSLGYETPTPIQRGAIPPALEGRDVLGCAQTGTGKTCAFAAPILQRLHGRNGNPRTIKALVLTPTRELAIQIHESFLAYGKHLSLRPAVIFGGVGQQPQVDQLKRGIDILTATPGRLLDLHGQKLIDLSHVEIFVLDEADRMLDMGFIHDVRRVLKILPQKKQTLFFSATMPPEVMELVNGLLHDYARVAVDPISSPVEVIRQSLYFVDKPNKTKLLAHLIQEKAMDSVLVFSRTKHGANRIAGDLVKRGITAAAIHGNKSQTARQQALANFKSGHIRALVATDIAARGIDIDELKWVVNYDLPEVPETYVHRIGRTGRAGHDGSALSFCRADERDYLKQIEKLLGRKIPVVEGHPFPMTEPPTGVDPMVQARQEARENARANSRARAPKEPPRPPLAAEKPAPPPPPEERPAPPPPQEGKSRRGRRQGDLAATLPAAPATPVVDFVKPNPLDSDVIMDATARLLAPRKPIYSQPKPALPRPEHAPEGGKKRRRGKGNKAAPPPPSAQTAPAAKQPPLPPKAEKQSELPKPKKASGPPAPAAKGKKHGRRRDVMERPAYGHRQKDSTEQAESVMRPYYLSDD